MNKDVLEITSDMAVLKGYIIGKVGVIDAHVDLTFRRLKGHFERYMEILEAEEQEEKREKEKIESPEPAPPNFPLKPGDKVLVEGVLESIDERGIMKVDLGGISTYTTEVRSVEK